MSRRCFWMSYVVAPFSCRWLPVFGFVPKIAASQATGKLQESRVAVGAEFHHTQIVALIQSTKGGGRGYRPMQCRLGVFVTNY